MQLILGILFGTLAQILVFFQIQGSLKYPFLQNNQWIVLLSGVPITWLFVESVKYIYDWSGGQLWPGRLIGFSIGNVLSSGQHPPIGFVGVIVGVGVFV